ncbi:response regulator [Desulfobulbus oligotrophicus]|jgi:DNA-binding NarL/FixJ family response regulator|uniref:Response regulator transcription factor n=1 Tax=Desulfobulbus oligotrophicus TaxID=1909699 RepID=A0A7T5VC32_9BACT|nr:response regulator transcription factor [Desulfobulbus oligotrophicus]MDY0390326.1 response regulator transcription factor [Desulfobulbus oligotrophicus]QQG65144.1 response regulator transcription factor [Desulfobulbus oligotrophicus]
MKKPRLLLADDHRLVAEGLRGLLEPAYQLVGIVEDGRALLEAADRLVPDVVVADISMPLLNGIEAVRQLKKKNPELAVVFLTMHLDVAYAASAFEAGASGYVLKHSASSELLTAIDNALKGRTYITPMLAGELLNYQRNRPQGEQPDGLARLTARQREVLQLIAEGLSVKEAAAVLGISARTVEFHKYSMMESLGLKNSAELMRFAVEHAIK